MKRLTLRKLRKSDQKYFAKWWRDKDLIGLTSGVFESITDAEVGQYFVAMLADSNDYHRMISIDGVPIGHIALVKSKNGWHETQIVIGEKKFLNKGYGVKAINAMLLRAREKWGIVKIYLDVRTNNCRAIRAYEKCGFATPSEGLDLEFTRMELKIG